VIKRLQQRRDLIDFCLFNKLKLTGTFFRHKNIHKFGWEARDTKFIIDYINNIEKLSTAMRDTRVFGGSEIETDHYLLQRKFKICKQYYIKKRNIKSTKATEN
jgi:hypothetical protein